MAAKVHIVAPPRGERGLKHALAAAIAAAAAVAPPRGERGLKLVRCVKPRRGMASLPLVGSVD